MWFWSPRTIFNIKCGVFRGIYIIVVVSARDGAYVSSLGPPQCGGSSGCPRSLFHAEITKNITIFTWKFSFSQPWEGPLYWIGMYLCWVSNKHLSELAVGALATLYRCAGLLGHSLLFEMICTLWAPERVGSGCPGGTTQMRWLARRFIAPRGDIRYTEKDNGWAIPPCWLKPVYSMFSVS